MKRFKLSLIRSYAAVALMATASALLCQSCFTGIESTDKVKLSRQDRKLIKPSDEEELLSGVESQPLGEWQTGKRFVVADRRISTIMRSASGTSVPGSDTLSFISLSSVPSPSGVPMARISFSDGNEEWVYDTHTPYSEARTSTIANRLPMLIDLDYVRAIDRILRGRTLYTLTGEWLSREGERKSGMKYFPVKVLAVEAGTLQFPLRVVFSDGSTVSEILMNDGKRTTDSRPFRALFSLKDQRLLHKNISDDVWELIRLGQVKTGMTKEECRLALGNPTSVDSGHDYSRIIDIWGYGDGATLRFEDGILSEVR